MSKFINELWEEYSRFIPGMNAEIDTNFLDTERCVFKIHFGKAVIQALAQQREACGLIFIKEYNSGNYDDFLEFQKKTYDSILNAEIK